MYLIRPDRLGFGEQTFLLMSDLHIGSPEVDYKLIDRELAEAGERDARILINGDIFDAIVPSDSKRYRPDAVHKRLKGKADLLGEAVRWAGEILGPYAEQIDLLGSGNHEDTILKHHSVDLVTTLAEKLGRPKAYGGYTGFVDYRFEDNNRHTHRYVVYYHHGAGGGASLGGAASEFTKKLAFIDADIVWIGHKHFRTTAHMRRLSCPLGGRKPKYRDVRYVMTGAYMSNWTGDKGSSRRASYAEDKGLPPQGKGGVWLTVHTTPSELSTTIEVA